jgi:uncharacterized protein (DUF2141 family)
MLHRLLGAMIVVAFGVGIMLADEAKGKFVKSEKGTITVKVGDKDVEYKVGKEAKVFEGDTEVTGKDRGKLFKGLKEGAEVTVTFDKDGDKVTVKEFKVKK